MRILLISDNEVLGIGGGSIEEYKYFDGLKNYISTHGGTLKVLSIDKPFKYSLTGQIIKSKVHDILSRVIGHSTYMFFVWQKSKRAVFKYKPDVIVLGRSRLGFIAKEIKKRFPDVIIICNMENVEYDYVDGYFANKNSYLSKLYILLEKACVKRDEKTSVKNADCINYLSRRDYNRTHHLYSVPKSTIENILPICIKKSTELIIESEFKNIVFVGSLGYNANSYALSEFIDRVWKNKFENIQNIRLIVAGRDPSENLINKLQSIPNCILYKNFSKIEDIVPIGALMIAPIQKGAGMKVKVAEALSMGLCIAASDEALVGYEEALKATNGIGLMRANSPEEYQNAIEKYLGYDKKMLQHIEAMNKKEYFKFYAYNRSRKKIQELIQKLDNARR